MMRIKTQYLWLSFLTLGLLASFETSLIPASSPIAMAKSSGGRSRGGSFKRATPPRRSTPSRSSSPTKRQRTPSYSAPRNQRDFNRRPSAIPIPIPIPNRYPSGYSDYNRNRSINSGRDQIPVVPSNDGIGGAILDDALINNGTQSTEEFTQKATTPPTTQTAPAASSTNSTAQTVRRNGDSGSGGLGWVLLPGAVIAGGAGLVLYNANKKKGAKGGDKIVAAAAGSAAEINNDILTISEVQVALLANSPIQQQLSKIVETMEIETSEQLKAQLQAVVVSLLRLPEYWSHAKVESQTFPNRTNAESSFEQWSMRERSKLNAETLTRDSFGLRTEAITIDEDEDPASYVVVTLLLGTTHDQPLFESVYSSENLQAILEKIAAITTPELLTFELIWSPQDASDSLTRDELTVEYGDLVMV
ncbi:DUF1517 domain-containing protein [filamentous cyanobacterium LEGE 11480]|uniref:DUF1517 domain-containing protein n=1 Tax=Romeriopsis navalis LEGE 11480 TaxID=2777977 RepID=A0A928VT86_9CYAN|nr:DUF1517 domain-containing protein [Romeriopsis navalis]MBE9032140.1 DUF1517 domain-containing protein [Romeriopsis navalis LEGE 11480]